MYLFFIFQKSLFVTYRIIFFAVVQQSPNKFTLNSSAPSTSTWMIHQADTTDMIPTFYLNVPSSRHYGHDYYNLNCILRGNYRANGPSIYGLCERWSAATWASSQLCLKLFFFRILFLAKAYGDLNTKTSTSGSSVPVNFANSLTIFCLQSTEQTQNSGKWDFLEISPGTGRKIFQENDENFREISFWPGN